jgi:hypothetical protein
VILTRDTFEIRESGGIRRALRDAAVSGIRVQPIDYSGLHLTEEQEILTGGKRGQPEINSDVWRSFVSHLLSGKLDTEGQLEHRVGKQKLNPSELAQLLNRGDFDLKTAIESYGTTISRHLRETTGSQALDSFVALIEGLNPQLRRQFLSATFDSVSESGEEGFWELFPNRVVVDMLKQANDEGKEISPTLIALLQKISQVAVPQATQSFPKPSIPSPQSLMPPLSKEQMQNLFSREAYETYVDDDYRALLTNLISRGNESIAPEERAGPSSAQTPADGCPAATPPSHTSQDDHPAAPSQFEFEVDAHFSRMILALMEESSEPEDYHVFSRKLVSCVEEHLSRGDFDMCLAVLQAFRKHAGEMAEPIRQLARDAIAALGAPHIASAAVAALDACGDDQREQAQSFVSQIGVHCIPHLVDLYSREDYPSTRRNLLEILVEFADEAQEEAFKRFPGASAHVLRNLLLLLQRIGNPHSVSQIRRLLSHENRQVVFEAMCTLLELRDPDGPLHLRRLLSSTVQDENLRYIALAGFYRISEVADDLVGKIQTLLISSSTLRRNEEILKSLGRIGDARILPKLEAVVRKSRTFSPRRLRHVKRMLFESLSGYPQESLAGLAQIGRKSRDGRIQTLCARLAPRNYTR